MDVLWRIRLLGDLCAEGLGREIRRFRTQKTASLLAYLACHIDRAHPREFLLEILWPEDDLEAARNKLRLALAALRRQLEPPGIPAGAVLVADRRSVALSPRSVTTDVIEFEAALEAARRSRAETERALALDHAVDLYRGELLPGFDEAWIVPERERLAEADLQSLRRLTTYWEQARDLERALDYARRAVRADPLREESHRRLIRVLAAAGQSSAARQQYRQLERLLQEELGEAPSAATRQLVEQLPAAGGESPDPQCPSPAIQTTGALAAAEGHLDSRIQVPDSPGAAPVGTVTFLLTDIERSTALWEKSGDAFRSTLATHHALLRREFRRHGGYEVKEAGDSFLVAFSGAGKALACAVASQRALTSQAWPPAAEPPRVRMALHTGDVELSEESYRDLTLHHASRMLIAAHGGQILCSEVTAALLRRGGEMISSADPGAEAGEPRVRLVDLGIYRLRDIRTSERLFQVEYPEMPQRQFPPLRAEAGFAGNLPPQFTRFFGREPEIGYLQQMLLHETADGERRMAGSSDGGLTLPGPRLPPPACRLLTLTGPGGSGKTRLALQVAGRLMEPFRGAVWFVPLADLSGPERIADAIREALRLPRSAEVTALDLAIEALAHQPSLLVLDNFEHVLAEGAPLVRALLERVPSLQFLVTSRERLDLEGEREFEVLPLPTPLNSDSPERLTLFESVQLFVDRAQAARPDFQVTNACAAAVAELCHRLEGIPLALELAAAWAKLLTPAQMLAHLEHRLDFLVSRRRGATARHRTLRAAIDWSYQLLPPELQRFFARLSVFRGGFSLEAAGAVCGDLGFDVLSAIASLVDKSLLRPVSRQDGSSPPSFVILESIREYAQECLERSGEAAAVRRRFADFFHVTGGTLPLSTGAYVVRAADGALHEALSRGEHCCVLSIRQMGKSSLMLRAAARLRQEGAAVALVDLTAIHNKLTAEAWYGALLRRVAQGLDREDELENWEGAHPGSFLPEHWLAVIRDGMLPHCPGRIVIIIDEMDAVRALPFSTDELFTAIRECHDRRMEDPELQRLTFCLLGVAAPGDLIRDPHAAPFDIGCRIDLTDFTDAEAASLVDGLGRAEPLGKILLQRILSWTAGHPYLTQRLCRAVAEDAGVTGPAGVDRLCEELFLSPRGRERDDNLLFVREWLLRSEGRHARQFLALYAQVLHGLPVPDDPTQPLINSLRLSGIVRSIDGCLRVRNRIYERVFDREWVELNLTVT